MINTVIRNVQFVTRGSSDSTSHNTHTNTPLQCNREHSQSLGLRTLNH